MRHEIPTHLEVEDRLLWSLTARQTLLLLIGALIGYSFWLNMGWLIPWWALRLAGALVIFVLSAALAFIRPRGRNLESWVFAILHYVAIPKLYIWQRKRNVDAEK